MGIVYLFMMMMSLEHDTKPSLGLNIYLYLIFALSGYKLAFKGTSAPAREVNNR